MKHKPLVLILCTGNSCRSQMAEAFLKHSQGEQYQVASAGTDPKPEVHPLAVRVMDEVGIDLSARRPKSIEQFLGKAPVTHLIVVCDRAHGTCPRVWPGVYTRTYVPFDDPADATGNALQVLDVFRRVRDEIREAMSNWSPTVERAGAGV